MSNKQDLSREIGFALSSATDFEQFIREANKREITVVPVIENGSEVKTVRYRYKNYLIGAGKLGPEYEWKTIAPKFGHDPIHICLTQIGMLSKQQDIFDNQIFCPITKEEDAREIRRKVVESDYFEGMWSTLSPEIEDAAIVKNAIQIRLQDGGRLSDHGTHVYAIDMSHQQAAEMLMRMALHKKWQTIQLRGNDVFLQNAMGIALDNGVEIDPLDEHQEKILAKVIGKRKSQGGGMGEGMNGPAPNMDHALNSLLGDRAVKSKMFEESKTKPRTKRPGGRV